MISQARIDAPPDRQGNHCHKAVGATEFAAVIADTDPQSMNPRIFALTSLSSSAPNCLFVIIFALVFDRQDGDRVKRCLESIKSEITTGAEVDHQFA